MIEFMIWSRRTGHPGNYQELTFWPAFSNATRRSPHHGDTGRPLVWTLIERAPSTLAPGRPLSGGIRHEFGWASSRAGEVAA